MNSSKLPKRSSQKEWKAMTFKDSKQVNAILLTLVLFVVVWITSDFMTAIGMVLVAWSIYFLVKAVRAGKEQKRIRPLAIAVCLFIGAGVVFPTVESSPSESVSVFNVSEQDITAAKEKEKLKNEEEALKKSEEKRRQDEVKRLQEEKASKLREDKAQQQNPSGDLYKVVSITDGDTIKVSINGKTETIRFIGMDTPETKDPRKPVQCYGREAGSRMQHYAQSKFVRLESDASQGDRDRYDRLLRYVFTESGKNIAYEMIREGYAHEYTYNKPYKYQSQFKKAYSHAQYKKLGLWSSSTCNGKTNQEHPPAPKPKPAAKPTQKPATQPKSTYYKNCTAARAAGAAPVYKGSPGYGTHLDRDRDGIGCE